MPNQRAYEKADWTLDQPVHFKNRQWAVTAYGIENTCGPYHYAIEKDACCASWWPQQMADKNWVDGDAFNEAHVKAVELFGKNYILK